MLWLTKPTSIIMVVMMLVIGNHAWLSTEHLPLVSGLSRKLASCFIGPYKVIEQIDPVSFKLELPLY